MEDATFNQLLQADPRRLIQTRAAELSVQQLITCTDEHGEKTLGEMLPQLDAAQLHGLFEEIPFRTLRQCHSRLEPADLQLGIQCSPGVAMVHLPDKMTPEHLLASIQRWPNTAMANIASKIPPATLLEFARQRATEMIEILRHEYNLPLARALLQIEAQLPAKIRRNMHAALASSI